MAWCNTDRARERAARVAAILALCLGVWPANAQEVDVEALLDVIDARTGQYRQLTEILQGPDAERALSAFDVMLETGDKTLRETALTTALATTDERLRARALWETLAQKDSFTIVIDTEALDADARTALDKWIGAVSTWSILGRFPDTQCLSLASGAQCAPTRHLSVSGLKVDIVHDRRIDGGFTLTRDGLLTGEVSNPNSNAVYPASIQLR